MATVFTFSVAAVDPGDDTHVDLTRRAGRIAWSDGGGEHVVTLARAAGGGLQAGHEQRP
jgi:hypothetical protein